DDLCVLGREFKAGLETASVGKLQRGGQDRGRLQYFNQAGIVLNLHDDREEPGRRGIALLPGRLPGKHPLQEAIASSFQRTDDLKQVNLGDIQIAGKIQVHRAVSYSLL